MFQKPDIQEHINLKEKIIKMSMENESKEDFPQKLLVANGYIGITYHSDSRSIVVYALGTDIEVGTYHREKKKFELNYRSTDEKRLLQVIRFRGVLKSNELPFNDRESRLRASAKLRELSSDQEGLASLLESFN